MTWEQNGATGPRRRRARRSLPTAAGSAWCRCAHPRRTFRETQCGVSSTSFILGRKIDGRKMTERGEIAVCWE